MARAIKTRARDADPRSARRFYLVVALALIAIAATFLLVWFVPAHGGVDENGYLVAGRQIALTGRPQLTPVHFNGSPVPTCVGDMWIGQEPGHAAGAVFPDVSAIGPAAGGRGDARGRARAWGLIWPIF